MNTDWEKLYQASMYHALNAMGNDHQKVNKYLNLCEYIKKRLERNKE